MHPKPLYPPRHFVNAEGLIFGFFPITSYKTALFLHNKLPGVFIPQSWLETMEKASHNNTELEIGLEKSQRLFENLCKIQAKIHLMSSNKVDIIGKILNGLFRAFG